MRKLWAFFMIAGAVFGASERIAYTSNKRIVVAGWNNYVWTQPDVAIPRPESCVLWLVCDSLYTVRSYGRVAITGMWDQTNCTSPPPMSGASWTFIPKTGVRFSNGSGIWTNLFNGTKPFTVILSMARKPWLGSNRGIFAIGNGTTTPDYAGMPYDPPNFVMQNQSGYDRIENVDYDGVGWTSKWMYSYQYDGSFSVAHLHGKTNNVELMGTKNDTLTSKITWSSGLIDALGIGRYHNETYNSSMTLYWLMIYDVELTDAELVTVYEKLF